MIDAIAPQPAARFDIHPRELLGVVVPVRKDLNDDDWREVLAKPSSYFDDDDES